MPIVINPASELAKELRKWEQHHTPLSLTEDGDSQPGNPYVYRPYPRMLYKAHKRPSGQYACIAGQPHPFEYPDVPSYERACLEVETFNRACQRIVGSEGEERRAHDQGWRESPAAALEFADACEQAIADAAAAANFGASRMSEPAQREWAEAAEGTDQHVVDVQPKRRGRKPKAVTGTGPVES